MCYNLLEERWLPVVRKNGTPARVGIREALEKAGEFREVRGASPLDTVAVYRFLLAVLQWCKPEPTSKELANLSRNDRFPPEWFQKLADNRSRFELLGANDGFYQSKQYEGDANRPATDLLPELPSGTSVAHFRHTRDFRDGLCPACCAVGLIRLSAFAPSGAHPIGKDEKRFKRGKPAGINGVTPAYALPLGQNLFDTLVLNWPLPVTNEDRPGWLGDEPPEREHIGPLAALTWRPRRVWLERPQNDPKEETCTYCASKERLIYRVSFLPGWRQPFEEKHWPRDPQLLIGIEESQAGPVRFPAPDQLPDVHARFWRKAHRAVLEALASAPDDESPAQHRHISHAVRKAGGDRAITVTCFGPAADVGRVALYKDGAFLAFPLPQGGLTPADAGKAIAGLDQLDKVRLLDIMGDTLPLKTKKRPEVKAALANATLQTEERLRQHFVRFVEALASGDPNAEEDWRAAVHECLAAPLVQVYAVLRKGSALWRQTQEASMNRLFLHALAKAAGPNAEGAQA